MQLEEDIIRLKNTIKESERLQKLQEWPNRQSGTFLKGRNAPACSATPKGLKDHRRQLKWRSAEFFPQLKKIHSPQDKTCKELSHNIAKLNKLRDVLMNVNREGLQQPLVTIITRKARCLKISKRGFAVLGGNKSMGR